MKEKIKNIPVMGKLLCSVFWLIMKIYAYITGKLLRKYISKYRWDRIKRNILNDFTDSNEADIQELVSNIRKQGGVRIFNYPFVEKYDVDKVKVLFDKDAEGYPYVIHNISEKKRRIYFPIEWSKEKIASAYTELLVEQDQDSPHCYQKEGYQVSDDAIILDLGVAEGNFSIGLADRGKRIYLFEGDSLWWRPLELTFGEWQDKVTLIPKYVSDVDNEEYLSLGTFLKKNREAFRGEKIYIKMDIEGYEEKVLRGCEEVIKDILMQHGELTMAICSYHNQASEKDIREILTDIGFMNVKNSKGYMVLNNFYGERVYPYFRRGLLFASTLGMKR